MRRATHPPPSWLSTGGVTLSEIFEITSSHDTCERRETGRRPRPRQPLLSQQNCQINRRLACSAQVVWGACSRAAGHILAQTRPFQPHFHPLNTDLTAFTSAPAIHSSICSAGLGAGMPLSTSCMSPSLPAISRPRSIGGRVPARVMSVRASADPTTSGTSQTPAPASATAPASAPLLVDPASVDLEAAAKKFGWDLNERPDWSGDRQVRELPLAAIRRPLQSHNNPDKVAALMKSIEEIGQQVSLFTWSAAAQHGGWWDGLNAGRRQQKPAPEGVHEPPPAIHGLLQEPIDVLEVEGLGYFGFSGCHRFEAHQRLGKETIVCKVRKANRQVSAHTVAPYCDNHGTGQRPTSE